MKEPPTEDTSLYCREKAFHVAHLADVIPPAVCLQYPKLSMNNNSTRSGSLNNNDTGISRKHAASALELRLHAGLLIAHADDHLAVSLALLKSAESGGEVLEREDFGVDDGFNTTRREVAMITGLEQVVLER